LLEEAPLPSEVEEPSVGALDQQTFYAIADATVLQGYPSQNLGSAEDMWAGYDEYLEPDGRIARSLVEFDIASLPPDIDITEATLRVYLVGYWDYPDTSRTIRTYRITSSWSESNVTWNNRPGYGSAYGSRSIVSGAWGWYEFDVTNLVSAWYDGTYTNHGVMLRGPETSGLDSSWRSFGTRESPYTPQLVIDQQAPLEYIVYLPIILKNLEPPSPCPQTGSWSGTTNQGYSISFTVADTPSCQAESLTIAYRCTCTNGSVTTWKTFDTSTSISNNHFDTGGSNPRVIGNFTSQTAVSGTWSSSFDDPDMGSCSGSGNWTANYSP
jgi:hypothetical protein